MTMKAEPKKRKILIIGGPTASGKSSFAIEIAKRCNGVVINADSMQLYDGLHMLTAHPSLEEQSIVPHYLYGSLYPDDSCSAAKWCEMAKEVVIDAFDAGKTPIIVGGTGFYLLSIVKGLSPIPSVPDEVLKKTIDLCDLLGRDGFAKKLTKLDPIISSRIDMNNPHRMIRALSVLEATGKSLAYWQDIPRTKVINDAEFIEVALLPKRDVLYQRCDMRFDIMIDNGVLEEVDDFLSKIRLGRIKEKSPLTEALGFKELKDYINGECDKETAISKAKQSTRRYAKKQVTWFNNQMHDNLVVSTVNESCIRKTLSFIWG